jgi:hypothetical protein
MIVTGSSPPPAALRCSDQLRRRLAHIDVDLVDLLHHRHRLGIGHADQRTFGHHRLVDAAGNRRADRGIAQVELATARIARASFTAHGPVRTGTGIVAMLLADRLRRRQRMQALRLHAAAAQRRLTALQRGQCRIDIGTECRRIDLEQGLAGVTSAPCSNSRRCTMPPTCARICAVRTAATRRAVRHHAAPPAGRR